MAKEKGTAAKGGTGAAADSPTALWVGRARAIGALVGFAIAFQVCRGQGFPVADAVIRALVAAAGMSLVAWWSALLVLQALMRSAVAQADREALEVAAAQAAAAQAADPAVTRRGLTMDEPS
jgi:hypothetical protein